MANAIVVAVVDGFKDLLEDCCCVFFRKVLFLNDALKQLSTRANSRKIGYEYKSLLHD